MKGFINYGGGVNSTAIVALLCMNRIGYKKQFITFADTGGEQPETISYVEYLNKKLKEFDMEIITVKSKEGSLYDYCVNKKILPMMLTVASRYPYRARTFGLSGSPYSGIPLIRPDLPI